MLILPRNRIRVLVCDDTDALRVLLCDLISSEAHLHAAGEARNGQDAIDQASRLQPDVILLDLSMPILNGLAAISAIKRAAPSAKIVVLTALSGSVIEKSVRKAGADSFLVKNALPQTIIDAITDAVKAASDFAEDQRTAPDLASGATR